MNPLSFYRYRIALYATVAVSFLVFASRVPAQNLGVQVHQPTQEQAQLQMLTQRVSQLEKKLAKLEGQVLHDEQTPQPADDKDDTSGGLSKADQARLNSMQKQIAQLEAALKDKKDDIPSRVTAPFEVVDANGSVIMEVSGGTGKDAAYRGVQVYMNNRSFVRLGSGIGEGYANVSIHKPGKEVPRLVMGMRPDGTPSIAVLGDGTGNFTSSLTETAGGGEAQYFNASGKLVARVGSGESTQGHVTLMDTSGAERVKMGTLDGHGDAILIGSGKAIMVYEFSLLGAH